MKILLSNHEGNKCQELLIQEYRNASEEIRHIESIVSQNLSFFLTIFLAYSTFLSTALLKSFRYCSEHLDECIASQIKIGGLFYFSKEVIGLIVFAGLVVTLVCYCILLIMTKASQTKFINKRNRNNIRDTIYRNESTKERIDVCIQVQKRQSDIISQVILSIRRISKIIPFCYILLLYIFTIFVVSRQPAIITNYVEDNCFELFNIRVKDYVLYEYIVLLIEALLVILYGYLYAFVWRNPISLWVKKLRLKLIRFWRIYNIIILSIFSTIVLFTEYYKFYFFGHF